jgi:hypothetical protein
MVPMYNPEVCLLTSDYVYYNAELWFKNINADILFIGF